MGICSTLNISSNQVCPYTGAPLFIRDTNHLLFLADMRQQARILLRCIDPFVDPAAIIYAATDLKVDPNLEFLDAECVVIFLCWLHKEH